jgi:hypothetical protein
MEELMMSLMKKTMIVLKKILCTKNHQSKEPCQNF